MIRKLILVLILGGSVLGMAAPAEAHFEDCPTYVHRLTVGVGTISQTIIFCSP